MIDQRQRLLLIPQVDAQHRPATREKPSQALHPRVPPPVRTRDTATLTHRTSSLDAFGTPSPYYRTRRTSPSRHVPRVPGAPWATSYYYAVARIEVLIGGLPYTLASAHLAPSSPTLRLIEAEAFALIAKEGTLIVGGDWNAAPATDPDPPAAGGITAGREQRKLDRSAARAIEETGLTDIAAHLGNLDPTVGHDSGLFYRCDRIYTSLPPEAITGYQVIAEEKPHSDHRPVLATFDLDAASRNRAMA